MPNLAVLALSYDGEFGEDDYAHAAFARLRWDF
jgi:hypothetical protein